MNATRAPKPTPKGKKPKPTNKPKPNPLTSITLPASKPSLLQRLTAKLTPPTTQADALSSVRQQVIQHLNAPSAALQPTAATPFISPLLPTSAQAPRTRRFRPWLIPLAALAVLIVAVYLGSQPPAAPAQLTMHSTVNPNTALIISPLTRVTNTSNSVTLATTLTNTSATPFRSIQVGFLVADASGKPLKALATTISATIPPSTSLTHTFTSSINILSPQRHLLTLPLAAFQIQPLILSAVPVQ